MTKARANIRTNHRRFAVISVLLVVMAGASLLARGETGALAAPRSPAPNGPASAAAAQACSSPSFASPATYPAGDRGSLQLADFNRDGYLDEVGGSTSARTILVLYGNSNGGFDAPVTVATGLSPYAMTVGDLNIDGFPDIVMTDFSANNITVIMNNGDGSFRVLPSVTVGSRPDSLLVADLNRDTFPDVAVSNNGSSSISVLLGNGQGGFTSAYPFPTGAGPQQVLVGDFNNDTYPDLTIANYQGNSVSVLINNGFGSFTSTNYPAGPGPAASVVGDFNSDGYLDTVVGNFSNRQVSVLLNDTNGHLYPPTAFPGGSQAGVMTSNDFNLDGIPDVVTANGDGSLSVFLGNGAGGLSAATNYQVTSGGFGVGWADVNKDGRPDLVTVNGSSNSTSVLLNTCGGANPTATATATATPTQGPSTFSDVPAGSPFYPFVTCLVNRGVISGYSDGTFRPSNPVTRGQLSKIVALAAGYSDPPGSQTFEDIAPGSTFYTYIQQLSSRGVIGGYPCGGAGEPCVSPNSRPYFRPNGTASRGQTSKIVAIAKGLPAPPSGQQSFQDVAVGSTFWQWIEALSTVGAIGGYPCGGAGEPCVGSANKPYFRPSGLVTRGQSSKIVANTFFPNCQSSALNR